MGTRVFKRLRTVLCAPLVAAIAAAAVVLAAPAAASAQPHVTFMRLWTSGGVWDTVTDDTDANAYLQTGAYPGSGFIDAGSDSWPACYYSPPCDPQPLLDLPLPDGTHTFTIYASSSGRVEDNAQVDLWFDGH